MVASLVYCTTLETDKSNYSTLLSLNLICLQHIDLEKNCVLFTAHIQPFISHYQGSHESAGSIGLITRVRGVLVPNFLDWDTTPHFSGLG